MGIERFFSTISNKYNIIEDIYYPYSKTNSTHIFIDFNSIVHVVSSKIKNPSDEIIINKVEEYIINLIKNNFISNKIKFLMIAIDGVPSKAKMIEQKKRRYMGELVSFILNKKKNSNIWSKNNISPGTNFMHILSRYLNSNKFMNNLKNICPSLDKIVISDIYKPEEGEKKITNKINNMNFNKKDKITIYSPDSDVILLAMILKIKNIDIILYRHDQQKSDNENYVFNLIEIKKLKNVIINYVKNENKLKNIDDQKIIDDIVLIFTIFGDDFLPKISSYDVKNDINIILDLYSLTLLKENANLIKNNKINFDFFTRLLEFMSLLEEKIINKNQLDKKYHNFKKYLSINFNTELNKLQKSIKNNESYKTTKSFDFIHHLVNKLDKREIYNTLNRSHKYYHYYLYFLDDTSVIEELTNYCFAKNTNIIPLKNINMKEKKLDYQVNLQKYNFSSKDKYHSNNLKNLTQDEKNEYILNNRLDTFYEKLNVEFGLEKELKNIDDNLIYQYLKGVNWIYQYYFEDNMNNKFWYYPYENTPLIKDIFEYLKANKNIKFNYNVITDQSKFFTVLEQLLFITPFNYNYNLIDNILNSDQKERIKKFINSDKYKKFYFDLENISNKIMLNKKNDQIDCHDALYINKCRLIELSNHYDPDDDFINDFRKYISLEEQQKIYKFSKLYTRILNL